MLTDTKYVHLLYINIYFRYLDKHLNGVPHEVLRLKLGFLFQVLDQVFEWGSTGGLMFETRFLFRVLWTGNWMASYTEPNDYIT